MLLPKANTPRWIIILLDLMMSLMALFFAYLIRFDLKADVLIIKTEWDILSKSIVFYVVIKLVVFYLFKIHKGLVRHTSTEDLKRIISASLICSILFVGIGILRYYFYDGYYLFPTSVLLIEFMAASILLLGSRFAIKLIYIESVKTKTIDHRVLIYGAGISGLITKRTIEKDVSNRYKIIGFIDDNKKLSGNRLEGVTIFNTSKLETLISDEGVSLLIIAIQNPDKENKKRIAELCLEKRSNNTESAQSKKLDQW
jgi:FlaA1/EpsC-like NDP-sugar epimerase